MHLGNTVEIQEDLIQEIIFLVLDSLVQAVDGIVFDKEHIALWRIKYSFSLLKGIGFRN